jgi:hypothetical protein
LAPDFWLADAFDDFHPRITQDKRACAVHTRVRVAHSDHDSDDAALGNRSRAGGRTAVEGTRLEGGIECRANDAIPPPVSVARRGDFCVVFTWAERMAAP